MLAELAESLPLALPVPQWQAFDLASAPHGISGHRKLPGAPLDSELLTGARARGIAGQIAEFLVALHEFQPTELTASLPVLDPQQALTADFCASARAALELQPTKDEVRALDAWFADAPAAFRSSDPRVITHGDLWYENLLVQAGSRVTGVLDWSAVALSEPARDLAPLTYNGIDFLAATSRAYAEATRQDAEELRARAGEFLLLRELTGLVWAAHHDAGELPDAVGKVVSLLRRRASA